MTSATGATAVTSSSPANGAILPHAPTWVESSGLEGVGVLIVSLPQSPVISLRLSRFVLCEL